MAKTFRKDIVANGHGSLSPWLFAIHSTANPSATAQNHRDYWKREPDYAVHLVSDWKEAIQCVEFNRKCWQVGNGNSTCIGLEICEATNYNDFKKGLEVARNVIREVLDMFGWQYDVIRSHKWFTENYGGSDHTDPIPYFNKYGWSWEDFIQFLKEAPVNENVTCSVTQFSGRSDQRWWKKVDEKGNTIGLRNAATYNYLSDPHSSTTTAPAKMYEDDGEGWPRQPQRLIITEKAEGLCTISPECAPNLCLDVNNAGMYDNCPVQWFEKNGSRAQDWIFVPNETGNSYQIVSALNYMVLGQMQ